jgi:phosphatidylglycerol:prolipoprotein diacylglycerol transferase
MLYETALLTIAFMVIWSLRMKPYGTGWLFGLYLVFAGAERFAVEFLRLKDDRFLAGFTLAQLTSVLLVLAGIALIAVCRRRGEADPGAYLKGGKAGG